MKKYNHLLLDLDGTLINSKEGVTRSVAYALESFGIQVQDTNSLCNFIGPPLKDSFMHFYQFKEAQANEAVLKYRERYAQKGIFENTLYQGISAFLPKARKKGYTLRVATSKPTVFAKQILDVLDISNEFLSIVGSELDGSLHTKTDVINHLIKKDKLSDMSSIVMIGDRKFDILGAKDIGIDSIGVLWGFGNREELDTTGASYIVEDVSQLEEFLNI